MSTQTISSSTVADLLIALYDSSKWDQFDFVEPGTGDDGVCWAVKHVHERAATLILLRGSVTFQDWIRDLIALAAPWVHKGLGPVHPGFLLGMENALEEMRAHISYPAILAGHSLGAGRSAILAGLMTLAKIPVIERHSFGEPKPGFEQLSELISPIPAWSYRNGNSHGHDLVTDVPLSFPPEEYVHSVPLVEVCAAPPASDDWGVFAWHHMELYARAVSNA